VNAVGFDTETHLIAPDQPTPRLVCGTFAWEMEGRQDAICDRDGVVENFKYWAEQTNYTFVMHNAAFDTTVLVVNYNELLPVIIDLYQSKRIVCTQINERLNYLARNSYLFNTLKFNLATCYERHTNIDISATKEGDDIWRLRYNELDGVPLAEWPADATKYALDDPWVTLELYKAQLAKFGAPMDDMYYQAYADFCLRMMTTIGFATDPKAFTALKHRIQENIAENLPKLETAKLYAYDPKKEKTHPDFPYKQQKKVFQRIITLAAEEADIAVPRKDPTDKMIAAGKTEGNISCDKDAVSLLAPYSKTLQTYQKVSADLSNQSKYVKPLSVERMHSQFNILMETGRTSSKNPNSQNFPREAGYRECLVPDPGHLLLAIDYSYIELVALAYVTKMVLGKPESELMLYQTILSGKDPHLMTAIEIMKAEGREEYTTYEDILAGHKEKCKTVKQYRQMAKAVNFGLPGGLGAATFVDFARGGYGVDITVEKAEVLKDTWMKRTYPEMESYFDFISSLEGDADGFTINQVSTDRIRAGASYCSACNSYFQGLAADGAKRGIIKTFELCYTNPEYFGCCQKLFIHDEILFQIPNFSDKARRQSIVDGLEIAMVTGMQEVMPGMPVGVESTLTERWIKSAEPVFDSMGYLDVYKG